MKKLSILLAVIVASVATAIPSKALGLHVGPRLGVNVNSLHFNSSVFDSENRAGFTGGVELNLSLPLGFGVDASVMYARRTANIEKVSTTNMDYITVPINLEWGLDLPLLNKVMVPYIYTGPDFAFRVSKAAISEAWNDHKVDVAWDFGLGVQLIKHLRVSATYGLGLTKWANKVGMTGSKGETTARSNCWTITAAWLF